MITTIAIEIVLVIVTLVAGRLVWQFWKRDQFQQRVVHDAEFLSRLITPCALDSPPSTSLRYLQRLPQGYAVNVQLVLVADRRATRILKIFSCGLIIVVLVGSYFLGLLFLLANALLFFVLGLEPASEQARTNALSTILEIACILDRWRAENPEECDEWIKIAWSLRTLYDAVTAARAID